MRISKAWRPVGWGALALGSAAITASSLGYFSDEELPAFVIEKLPLPHQALWLLALQVHVVAAALALPACLVLVSGWFLRRFPRAHRWLGRTCGVVVLFALVPSGLYLSLFAKGGVAATVGFALSGLMVALSMVQGIRTARARELVSHRRWVMHVLAQLGVAVSSRVMLFAFDALGADATRSYLLSLWLPVLGSAFLVEMFHPNRRFRDAFSPAGFLFARRRRLVGH